MPQKRSIDIVSGWAYYSDRIRGLVPSNASHMRLTLSLLISFIAIMGCFSPQASIAKDGDFPGRGNYQNWLSANSLYNEGNALKHAKEFNKAIDKYKAALAIYPYDHGFYNNLGGAYQGMGDLKSAELSFRKAIELDSNNWNSWGGLAEVLRDQGRLRESLEAYNKSISLDPPERAKKILHDNVETIEKKLTGRN